jgi:group I intron endonuclease
MIFHFIDNENCPVIYEIRNTFSNKSYIGQTMNPKHRWVLGHKYSLIKKAHRNILLQRDYDKCKEHLGHDDFLEFHIIEILCKENKEKIGEREMFWINQYKQNNIILYNIILENSGLMVFSNETRKKMSDAKKEKWKDQKYRENMVKSHTGKRASEETKQKMSLSKKGLNNWSRGKKIIRKVTSIFGKKHHNSKIYDNITLQSPDGKIYHKIECAAEFARLHNLNVKGLNKLLCKKCKTYKKWKLLY